MKPVLSVAAFLLLFVSGFVSATNTPSFEDVLSLRSVDNPRISPDGEEVIFEVRSTDWSRNEYDTELWLARNDEPAFQLTRTHEGSSNSARWSPDGVWISFLAKRGEKTQIHLIRAAGGEAQVVTEHKQGVKDYRWTPDSQRIAFISEDERESAEPRKKRYGAFAVEDNEFSPSHIWWVTRYPRFTRLGGTGGFVKIRANHSPRYRYHPQRRDGLARFSSKPPVKQGIHPTTISSLPMNPLHQTRKGQLFL